MTSFRPLLLWVLGATVFAVANPRLFLMIILALCVLALLIYAAPAGYHTFRRKHAQRHH